MPESVTPCTNTFCAKKKMIRMGSKARIETAINWLTGAFGGSALHDPLAVTPSVSYEVGSHVQTWRARFVA
jgi:hypothetical protein